MTLTMHDSGPMDCNELQAFLAASQALTFSGPDRSEAYAWIERSLRQYNYLSSPRAQQGLLRRYLQKMTGYSPAQLTRLIAQFRRSAQLRPQLYQRHRFPRKFTKEDQLLLAAVDQAHECLSGSDTQAILKREYQLFGRIEYERLSQISVAHLYNLRHSTLYRAQGRSTSATSDPTPATPTASAKR